MASQTKKRGAGAGGRISSTQHQIIRLSLLVVALLLTCQSGTSFYIDDELILEIPDSAEVENLTQISWQKAYQDLAQKLATLHAEFTHLENLMLENSQNINSLRSEVYIGKSSVSHQIISLEAEVHSVAGAIMANKNSIGALQSGLNAIQNSVSSNENHIRALSRRTSVLAVSRPTANATQLPTNATTATPTSRQPTTLINGTAPVVLNCGGRIPVFAKGESKLITYKINQTYSNNERCLWSLDNEAKNIRDKQTLRIKLIRHGFAEVLDWLFALKFNRDTGLVSQRIELGQEFTFSEDQLYLSFTSDHSVTGTGFEIQLDVIESVEVGRGWTTYISSSDRNLAVGAYADNDLINMIINPSRNITFEVNSVHTEMSSGCEYDRLMVWEIGALGRTTLNERLCGNISTSTSSFESSNPVLAIFSADASNTGPPNAGFKFTWK